MRILRNCIAAVPIAALIGATGVASADSDRVHARRVHFTIENVTHAITFRPFLVAVHRSDRHVFRTGEPAMEDVQTMAECGGLDALVDRMKAMRAEFVANPVQLAHPFAIPLGLLFPAGTTAADTVVPFDAGLPGSVEGTFVVRRKQNTHLSVVAMLLPTNDGFAGLEAVPLPRSGERIYYLHAYDAGTEANNEVPADPNPLDCVINEPGYPIDPLGNAGTGGAGDFDFEASHRVHIHRGNVGDADPFGGFSDLDSRIHRWDGPVVKLTVDVRPIGPRDHGEDDDSDD
jgi:hypothetical protein